MSQYPGPPAGYGHGYQPPAPPHAQATVILVLGILSIVACQVLGPVAWVMGNRAMVEIGAAGGAIGGRDLVTAGRICGIIGTVLLVVSAVFLVIWLVVMGSFMAATTRLGS